MGPLGVLEALPVAELSDNDADELLLVVALACVVLAGGFFRCAGRLYEASGDGLSSDDEQLCPARFYLTEHGLSVTVAACSLAATYTSAGMVNGMAETMVTEGLVWSVGTFAWPASLALSGLAVAPRLRRRGCVTVIDPLQDVAGERLGALYALPVLLSMVFWAGSILSSLASTAAVIVGGRRALCAFGSVAVALSYTLFGGLRAVALTDVCQLIVFCVGLLAVLPVCAASPFVRPLLDADGAEAALGSFERSVAHVPYETATGGVAFADLRGEWVDRAFTCLYGQCSHQIVAQRFLAARSPAAARRVGMWASACHLGLGLLCAAFAYVATRTDWALVGGQAAQVCGADAALLAPCLLRFVAPRALGWAGLAAVGAAMMSSIDSAVLAAASLFVWNFLWRARGWGESSRALQAKEVARLHALDAAEADEPRPRGAGAYADGSDGGLLDECAARVRMARALRNANRAVMLLVAMLGGLLAWQSEAISLLVLLLGDLTSSLVTTPLLCALHWRGTNAYGLALALAASCMLRVASGEPRVGIRALVRWPGYCEEAVSIGLGHGPQLFPFRTAIALGSLPLIVVASAASSWALFTGRLPPRYDVLGLLQRADARVWASERGWVAAAASGAPADGSGVGHDLAGRGAVGEGLRPSAGSSR